MEPLITDFNKNEKYGDMLNKLMCDKSKLLITGLTDSAKAHVIYTNTEKTDKNSVIVCSNISQANKMVQDLKFFSGIEILYYPAKTLVYYDVEVESKEIENQRLYVTEKISKGGKHIIVTTIDALIMQIAPNKKYTDLELVVKNNQILDLTCFIEDLNKLGFERTENVEGKGQFAVRGAIIDLFAINSDLPYRIELFGDEVDSIRTFDPLTQRSIDTLNKIELSFASESYFSNIDLEKAISKLKKLTDSETINSDLKSNILEDISKIEDGKLANLVDKYFSVLIDSPETFLEYVKGYNIYINEPNKCREKASNMLYENVETIKILGDRNYIYIPYANKYLNYDDILVKLSNFTNIYLETFKASSNTLKDVPQYNFDAKEFNFYKTSMDILLNDINIKIKNRKILLVFPSSTRVEQVKNYLMDNKVKVEVLKDISLIKKFGLGKVYIVQGILSGGYEIDELSLLIIAEPVSGVNFNKQKKVKKSTIGHEINSYDDLEVGDYVVHENHGIGRYKGIETIRVEDTFKDYIKIEFADSGMLYVPINQLNSVRKYVCDDDTKPKLNSLGTKEWERTKRKVSEHVKEVAKELMVLYAKREKCKGYAFLPDTPWQKEFEDSFPYELTNDQKVSIDEVKADLEDVKPMDRLLCGDVGYGKTEVALRAAFKVALNGKQVAYLVPTTVLSLQQYRTFKSRMEGFGVKVEMLSRFKSKKEQTEILKELVDGKIDIVVGTHRLLSKDVFFKDLGLLVIDEEHRFGVKAKESIKTLKETVDVLSMTATPIPRTLHMSMIGVRGMSTLTEPPMERLPVHTYVMEYDKNVIKEAIEKELARDGQVFYISNRVNDIEEITAKVRDLVPEARIAYAHGQMNPDEIENIMLKFINHELDVIVCTTILESGIDIQNANTIIVENADRLGLAQLYQIRGRVGRSNRLSYAYITYEKNKQLSEVSEKRLKAIRDFTEFGSGFKIALRDLEIRGAGNLLGKAQHGHMAKVGYELYLAMLEKAINEEKNGTDVNYLKEEVSKEIKMDIEISAYISNKYIKDEIQKISMYQKISDIDTKEDTMDVVDELLDRYGEIPRETENLIKVVEIRNAARALGITRIIANKSFIKFEPSNLRINLTNTNASDILIRVQLEISKLQELFK